MNHNKAGRVGMSRLSEEERSERARRAINARWDKEKEVEKKDVELSGWPEKREGWSKPLRYVDGIGVNVCQAYEPPRGVGEKGGCREDGYRCRIHGMMVWLCEKHMKEQEAQDFRGMERRE